MNRNQSRASKAKMTLLSDPKNDCGSFSLETKNIQLVKGLEFLEMQQLVWQCINPQSHHHHLYSSANAVYSAFIDESNHTGYKSFFQGHFNVLVQEV